jgi:hypothetical protein
MVDLPVYPDILQIANGFRYVADSCIPNTFSAAAPALTSFGYTRRSLLYFPLIFAGDTLNS